MMRTLRERWTRLEHHLEHELRPGPGDLGVRRQLERLLDFVADRARPAPDAGALHADSRAPRASR